MCTGPILLAALTLQDAASPVFQNHKTKEWTNLDNITFSFDCTHRPVGFYADMEYNCQVSQHNNKQQNFKQKLKRALGEKLTASYKALNMLFVVVKRSFYTFALSLKVCFIFKYFFYHFNRSSTCAMRRAIAYRIYAPTRPPSIRSIASVIGITTLTALNRR